MNTCCSQEINKLAKPQQEAPSPLPRLDGVTYKAMQSQDGRNYVIATGNTMNKKEFLKAAGFMWNSQQRV